MLKIKKAKISKIKGFFKKLPRILGEHVFITSLVLIFLASGLGTLAYYKYSILVSQKDIEISEKPLYFDEKSFQEILEIWQKRQKKFQEAEIKIYPDLFRTTPPSGELTE